MRVLLLRHTAADLPAGICYGRLDVGVRSPAAMHALAHSLALDGFRRVVTSPSRRCQALADAVAMRCGTKPTIDERLLELDFGAWEGMAWDDVPRAELDPWAANPRTVAPRCGETGAALVRRVSRACDDIRSAGTDCVVVSHGGPLKLMRALLAGGKPDLLAQAPGLGSAETVDVLGHTLARMESATHSTTTAQAPSASPV